MSAIQVLNDFTFTYEKASVWGTATGSAPRGIPTEDMPISIEPVTHEVMRSYGFRGKVTDNVWQESSLSVPVANFTAPVVPQMLKELLPTLLQSGSAWTTGSANIYSMFPKQYAGLPNPANGEGTFVTLVRNSPVSGNDVILNSAVAKSLKLTVDVKNENAILIGAWDFIGKGFAKNTTAPGTISNLAITNAYRFSAITACTFNSIYDLFSYGLTSIEWNITNGAKFVNDLPTGGVVFPKWEVTGNFKVAAGADSETLKDLVNTNAAGNAAPLVVSFGDGTVSTAGEMNITCNAYLTKYDVSYTEGEVITFSFIGTFNAAGTAYPIKFDFFA